MRFGGKRRTQGKGQDKERYLVFKERPYGEVLSSHLDVLMRVLIAQAGVSTWSGGDSWSDLQRKVGAEGLDLVNMTCGCTCGDEKDGKQRTNDTERRRSLGVTLKWICCLETQRENQRALRGRSEND